jgi:hypothetical protein
MRCWSLGLAELSVQTAGVERHPWFIGDLGNVVPVELHEGMDQVAADGAGSEQLGELREV